MLRTWEAPKIIVEEFVPNEYVSACGDSGTVYKFECNAGVSGKYYAVKDANGNVATISGRYMSGGLFGASYHPCGETHKAEENSGFLTGYHIDDVNTQKDENIEVIIWTENNTNAHCTTELDMDNWETAKS